MPAVTLKLKEGLLIAGNIRLQCVGAHRGQATIYVDVPHGMALAALGRDQKIKRVIEAPLAKRSA